MVAVAYRRWSFTRGFNCKALTGKILAVLDWRSLMGGGRLRGVVADGGSTAFECHISGTIRLNYGKIKYQSCNPYITS